ncbi:MAG TPA: arsenate reductase (glutaredoxin) [Thermomonas sp.]|nr:arsenate reductase (glutaredoxin) [Thermomonas sp.]
MPVEIWHNPACSVSRNTLALIRHVGLEPAVIEYLQVPPDKARLRDAIAAAGLGVRDALRTKEPAYAAKGLDDPSLTDEALLDAMLAEPALLNRPFVFSPLGVRLCRPDASLVLDILPPCDRPFRKENGEVVIDERGHRVR